MRFRIVTEPVGPVAANCHLLEFGDKVILIDPGGDPDILLGLIGKRALFAMLITHGHYDHIGAIGALKERHPQAAVMIHRVEAPFLADPALNLSGHFGIDGRYGREPERLLDHGDRIDLPDGSSLTVIHTPGHTAGGVCFNGDGVLFSGDTLFFESVGRCDLPGGDEKALLASIRQRILTLPDDTLVLPGHERSTTIGHEKRHNPFLDGDI